MGSPQLSLLISLFSGRLEQFDLSLQSLAIQHFPKEKVELLVFVDYVSNGEVVEVLRKYRTVFSSVKAYIVTKKKYPVAHSATRRNFLVSQAKGEYVVFSEPEMLHVGRTVNRLLLLTSEKNNKNWICGPVYAAEDFVDENGKMIVNEYRQIPPIKKLLEIACYKDQLNDPTFHSCFHEIDYTYYTTPFFIVCLNRKHFIKIGGLNQNFKVRGYEETEFYQRFQQSGGHIIVDSELISIHLPHPRTLNRESQVCWDLYNSTVLFDKHQHLGRLDDAVYKVIEVR